MIAYVFMSHLVWVLGCYQERCTQDWCFWSTVFAKAVRKSHGTITCGMMIWNGQPNNHTFQLLSKHGVSPCSATLHKCQMKQMPASPLEELETTRTPSYYMDEDYPSRP